eukprot:812462-Pyramimonas_sp.AAC.1
MWAVASPPGRRRKTPPARRVATPRRGCRAARDLIGQLLGRRKCQRGKRGGSNHRTPQKQTSYRTPQKQT